VELYLRNIKFDTSSSVGNSNNQIFIAPYASYRAADRWWLTQNGFFLAWRQVHSFKYKYQVLQHWWLNSTSNSVSVCSGTSNVVSLQVPSKREQKRKDPHSSDRHSHSSVYQSCAGPEILTKESGRRKSTLMQVWNIQGPLFGRQSPFIGMVIRTMPNFAQLPLRGLPLHASLPLNRFLECRLIAPLPFTPFSSRSAVFRSTHMLRCQRVGLTL